jgi:UDPglucose 6-dehydrogenase
MNISFIGCGYVGLVSAAGFSDLGYNVTCFDNDHIKLKSLQDGKIPFHEPDLEELVKKNIESGNLTISWDLKSAVESSSIIFLAVGTPQQSDGSANLSFLNQVFSSILEIASKGKNKKLVVIKSTVPVGTGKALNNYALETTDMVRVANNPEFLREGSAVDDFMNPDRIVFGTSDNWSEKIMNELYAPFKRKNRLIFSMGQTSAELVKYTSNSMLAMRISFMNEVAKIADASGADIRDVIDGVGSDSRIGSRFLSPGPGFGGSCFGKDLSALFHFSDALGIPSKLAEATIKVNHHMQTFAIDILKKKLGSLEGRTIGVLGLSFKPHTDDVRDSSSIPMVNRLHFEGAKILLHDPVAIDNFKKVVSHPSIEYVDDASSLLSRSDAVILATDWDEYQDLDADSLEHKILFLDMRRSAGIFSVHPKIDYVGFGVQSSDAPKFDMTDNEPILSESSVSFSHCLDSEPN